LVFTASTISTAVSEDFNTSSKKRTSRGLSHFVRKLGFILERRLIQWFFNHPFSTLLAKEDVEEELLALRKNVEKVEMKKKNKLNVLEDGLDEDFKTVDIYKAKLGKKQRALNRLEALPIGRKSIEDVIEAKIERKKCAIKELNELIEETSRIGNKKADAIGKIRASEKLSRASASGRSAIQTQCLYFNFK
jgi:hypothetical protein